MLNLISIRTIIAALTLSLATFAAQATTLTYDFTGLWQTTPSDFTDPNDPDNRTFSGSFTYTVPTTPQESILGILLTIDLFGDGTQVATIGTADTLLFQAFDESFLNFESSDVLFAGLVSRNGLADSAPLQPLLGDTLSAIQLFFLNDDGSYFDGTGPVIPASLALSDFDQINLGLTVGDPLGQTDFLGTVTAFALQPAATIPLPASLPMLALGVLGLWRLGRHRGHM